MKGPWAQECRSLGSWKTQGNEFSPRASRKSAARCCKFLTWGTEWGVNCHPGGHHLPRQVCYSLSHVRLFGTPWTVACQAPLSMEFSRQEYWSGLPFPSSGDLPDPGMEPRFLALQADCLSSEPPRRISPPWPKSEVKSLSCVWLFVTPWTVAYQASPSIGFSRQEYWSGLPFPSPEDLPDPGIEPRKPLPGQGAPKIPQMELCSSQAAFSHGPLPYPARKDKNVLFPILLHFIICL